MRRNSDVIALFIVGVFIAFLLLTAAPVSCDGPDTVPTPTTGQMTPMTCLGCWAHTREVQQ